MFRHLFEHFKSILGPQNPMIDPNILSGIEQKLGRWHILVAILAAILIYENAKTG